MQPRNPHEQHRAATPLELLFDLCFVVAIASGAGELHHALSHGEVAGPIISYLLVFFAIWWAWMNYTWFASAYDPDDTLHRLGVLVQMGGVLVLAAGVPQAFEHHNFRVVTAGYVIMRLALISQWLRAAHCDPARRTTARRYAGGLFVVQLGWVALALLPVHLWAYFFLGMAPAELLVPVWAERAEPTPWHPGHIAERYGLLTLIVLGEVVLSTARAIQAGLEAGLSGPLLAATAVGALLTLFSMWWLYFLHPAEECLTHQVAFLWGYGHYAIFASAAAVGAGLAAATEQLTHHGQVDQGMAIALPAAIYIVMVWVLQLRPGASRATALVCVAGAVLVLVAGASPRPILSIGLMLALLAAAVTLSCPVAGRAQTD
ncbi:MAG: low temperature requirement protein A [Vulcanimicrobiota bacterium]